MGKSSLSGELQVSSDGASSGIGVDATSEASNARRALNGERGKSSGEGVGALGGGKTHYPSGVVLQGAMEAAPSMFWSPQKRAETYGERQLSQKALDARFQQYSEKSFRKKGPEKKSNPDEALLQAQLISQAQLLSQAQAMVQQGAKPSPSQPVPPQPSGLVLDSRLANLMKGAFRSSPDGLDAMILNLES